MIKAIEFIFLMLIPMPVLMFSAWWCARMIKENRHSNSRSWAFARYVLAVIGLGLIASATVVWIFACFATTTSF